MTPALNAKPRDIRQALIESASYEAEAFAGRAYLFGLESARVRAVMPRLGPLEMALYLGHLRTMQQCRRRVRFCKQAIRRLRDAIPGADVAGFYEDIRVFLILFRRYNEQRKSFEKFHATES